MRLHVLRVVSVPVCNAAMCENVCEWVALHTYICACVWKFYNFVSTRLDSCLVTLLQSCLRAYPFSSWESLRTNTVKHIFYLFRSSACFCRTRKFFSISSSVLSSDDKSRNHNSNLEHLNWFKISTLLSLFRRVRSFFGGGIHFKLERTSCQQSLKYTSLYNTGGAPFSTEKRNIFLCT